MWDHISEAIGRATGRPFSCKSGVTVGGGCINDGYLLQDEGGTQRYFAKLNVGSNLPMFQTEARGLAEIAAKRRIRVPQPICSGQAGTKAFLVLEALEMGGPSNWSLLGQQLAELHRCSVGDRFGWHEDNFIGATPQKNDWSTDWVEFFLERRLRFQFDLARRKGQVFAEEKALLAAVPRLLSAHEVRPALLHGDLWSGNAAFLRNGAPTVFDVACYLGDAEADLAMTRLFGGFPHAFYAGYHALLPQQPGWRTRFDLYNLYHVLNHFNLFGGGYAHQAANLMQRLLAD